MYKRILLILCSISLCFAPLQAPISPEIQAQLDLLRREITTLRNNEPGFF